MTDFLAEFKSLLAVEQDKERILKDQLKDVRQQIKLIKNEIFCMEAEYIYKLSNSDFLHVMDESLTPYAGYNMTMCGIVFTEYEMDDETPDMQCPQCRAALYRLSSKETP